MNELRIVLRYDESNETPYALEMYDKQGKFVMTVILLSLKNIFELRDGTEKILQDIVLQKIEDEPEIPDIDDDGFGNIMDPEAYLSEIRCDG